MQKNIIIYSLIILFLLALINANAQNAYTANTSGKNIAFPKIQRVSAYEAFVKVTSGRAFLVHAGGMSYKDRHIVGAIHISQEDVLRGKIRLPNLPRKGIEIFTYRY
jgi:hypothetical protein